MTIYSPKVMHATMVVAGTIGFLALISAWIAGENGSFLGFSQSHLYWDALNLQAIAISAGICTLVRRQMVKENPGQFL